MKRAKVMFEYSPQEDDELKLKVGDIISDVEAADTGWCVGVLNGKRGMFPDNFVQIIESEEKPAPPSAQKKPSKRSPKRRMKATFAYSAENDDEISLEVGDVIEVIKDVEEGWAEGVCKGKRGVFPTNFAEKLPESSESEESADGGVDAPEPAKETQNEEVMATSSQKKVKGVGFGNIFGDGPIKLRQTSDRKTNLSSTSKATPVKEKETTKEVSTPSVAKSKKNVEYCKVMFEYTKDNDDELSLIKGEIITIIAKDGGDEGWWEGEKMENGKKVKGVFPDNFVALLSQEEAREHEKQMQAKSEPDSSTDSKHVKSPTSKVTRPLSFKKTAPLVPPPPSQGAKPNTALNSEVNHDDTTGVILSESATTEHTLAQIKRPAGPKNRRKPGAAERREKAQSSDPLELNGDEVESDDEKPIKTSIEGQTPKKDSAKRGVAVLPGPEGGSGETPSWLQNLKNRQSHKRPPSMISPQPAANKETPPTDAKPAWMQNLKKRQSSEFPGTAGVRPAVKPEEPANKEKVPLQPTEKVPLQPPKQAEKLQPPKPSNGHAPAVPPAKPLSSTKPPQRPAAPAEKQLAAWQVERQQKTKKKAEGSAEEPAPEPPVNAAGGEPATAPPPPWKNSLPRKSPVATKPPEVTQPAQKPKETKPPLMAPASLRTKPAPPKGKPAPAVKPASSSAVEELKEEMKLMKEEMGRMRDEMKKEIFKLNEELLDEKKQRMQLQSEVAKLRLQLPS